MVRADAIEPARDFFPCTQDRIGGRWSWTRFAAAHATRLAFIFFAPPHAASLPCRPPNPDTISRLFSPPFPTFRRSLSLRPVGGRALSGLSSEVVVGGWLQLKARQEAAGGGVEVEGVGIEDTFPSGLIVVRVQVCHCVG